MSQTLLPLSDLPNTHNFKFTGILKDGTEKPCRVGLWPSIHGETPTHYVTGAPWSELAGWKRIDE